MTGLKSGDFVITKKNINKIQQRAVGLIRAVSGSYLSIYFVGAGKDVKLDESDVEFLDLKKTGKPYDKKICNICHLLKDNAEFDINQTDAKGRKTTRPSCKECRVAIDGKSLLPAEEKRMRAIEPQKGSIFTCPICNKRSIAFVTAKIVIDHDHQTGKARTFICDSCNTGLGRFKDNIAFFQRIIDYFKKYE